MEKFYHGIRRVASYTYTDSYKAYRESDQYKKDLNDYKKSQIN